MSASGEIRRASAADLPAIASLARECSAFGPPFEALRRTLTPSREAVAADEVWLVRIGRGVMGYYWLAPGEAATLEALVVADYAQRAGIGRALVGHMRMRAGEGGSRSVRVLSIPAAQPFFEAVGGQVAPSGNEGDRRMYLFTASEAAHGTS